MLQSTHNVVMLTWSRGHTLVLDPLLHMEGVHSFFDGGEASQPDSNASPCFPVRAPSMGVVINENWVVLDIVPPHIPLC